MQSRLNRLVIRTPEGCTFSLLLAGPITRFLAWLIDFFCVAGLTIAAMLVAGLLFPLAGDFGTAVLILLLFAAWFGYGIVLEWFWGGRTIGKKALRLRVIDEHGLRLTFAQVAVRNLLRLADMLPMFFLVGGVTCLLTRRSQRLGDLAANTVVVRYPEIAQPDVADVLGDWHKFNSFREYPHLEARLRQRVSPQEAGLAFQALLRRDELLDDARVELFAEIAAHFKSLVAFPQPAVEGLSDEHYVRNAVETLFRSQTR